MAHSHGPVIISAAGESSRLRGFISGELGLPDDYPKLLLPTGGPDNETLLGRIIRQATIDDQLPILSVTETNMRHMLAHPDIPAVEYTTEIPKPSLSAMYYRLRRTGERVLSCAGDFYSDFSWEEFISHHDESGAAMTLLVHRSTQPVEAAVFDIDPTNNQIVDLRRPPYSAVGDYTNIGAYVIDPVDEIHDVLDEYLPVNPQEVLETDAIFLQIMRRGLAGCMIVEGANFNVNTPSEYQALLRHTAAATDKVA